MIERKSLLNPVSPNLDLCVDKSSGISLTGNYCSFLFSFHKKIVLRITPSFYLFTPIILFPAYSSQSEWKKRAIIAKIFPLLPLSILSFYICTFFHKIVHIINMVILNKQLDSPNKNYHREKNNYYISTNYQKPNYAIQKIYYNR